MRLRNKSWAPDKIAQYPEYILTGEEAVAYQGKWQNRFAQQQPLHIEIGSGKGRFIVEMAKAHPEINFIGVELQMSVVVMILEKQILEKLPNLQILHANGGELTQYFSSGEVAQVYLNFSDPWPKKRHAKRRLTYRDFLAVYQEILIPKGEIHLKTDNQGLFEYSLISFSHYGLLLNGVYLDLHNSEITENIMTEYEEKFSNRGQRIYKAVVRYPN